ncbi:hypothetical protein [Paenibacillus sp. 1P03SA]|uniref:hypothetical protein n=1 Tax=Paenibacillus sp. 1P03SA TaxID=3132294 RepID=UPI0039A2A4B2
MNKIANVEVQKEEYQYLFYLENLNVESVLISSDLEEIIEYAKRTTRAFLDSHDAWKVPSLPEKYSDHGQCTIMKLKTGVPASEYHQIIWSYCCNGEEKLEDCMEKLVKV